MSLTKNNFMNEIEKMRFFEKDYDTILFLMEQLPSNLFVKILEEVISGNLFWEDFEPYLEKIMSYRNILENSFESQKRLKNEISNILQFRGNSNLLEGDISSYGAMPKFRFDEKDEETLNNLINAQPDDEELTKLSDITISDLEDIINGNNANTTGIEMKTLKLIYGLLVRKAYSKFYESEKHDEIQDLLYSVVRNKEGETVLEKEFRVKIYNMIENGRILLENKDMQTIDEDGNLRIGNIVVPFYRTESLLLSPDDFILSFDENSINLNDMDMEYMRQNNLSEADVKKLKALSRIYRRDEFLSVEFGKNIVVNGGLNG